MGDATFKGTAPVPNVSGFEICPGNGPTTLLR